MIPTELQPVWGPDDAAAAWALAQTLESERGELVEVIV